MNIFGDREWDELLERDKQSSEWEVAVQTAVAKQMKKLKFCSIVLADHKRTYNTLKYIFSIHIEKDQENSIDEPIKLLLQA